MEVRTILRQLNHRVIEQLVQENEWPSTKKGEGSFSVEDIASYITDPHVIAQMWETFTEAEKQVLLHFLYQVGEDIVTYRQMEEYAQEVSPLIIYSGLTGLRRRGLIYTLRRLWGELAYCMPWDIQTAFRSWLASIMVRQCEEPPTQGQMLSGRDEAAAFSISDVVFSILQEHRKQPVVLTKKGVLPMKTRRLWQKLIPYPDELFTSFMAQLPLESAAKDGFLLHLILSMGLLERQEREGEERYTVDEEQAESVFHGLASAVQRRLYKQVRRVISAVHPCYCAVFDWMEACSERRFSLCSLQKLENTQYGGENHGCMSSHWQTFAEEVIPLLVRFGFMTRQGEGVEAALTWTIEMQTESDGQRTWEGTGYVQPTFEVLLLPHAPYELRWRLGAYAELEEQQEVWRFRLTKASVQTVKRDGGTAGLLRDLERIQPDVPISVRDQIMQWLHSDSSVRVLRAVILRCPDVETADGLAADLGLSAYIEERLNAQDFLVDESHLASLKKAVKQKGISINEEQAAILEPNWNNILDSKSDLDVQAEGGYKIESVFPTLADTLPGLKDIPAIWHKNYQSYHHSTLRKLMTTAQTLGIPLSMEVSGQPLKETRIVDMRAEGGQYRLTLSTRNQRESVCLEEIGRVKLHLPS